MSEKLSADLNIIQSAPIELELLDGDLNIIQKLDDEPNDVGGLTSAELKAKFDESGNIIKKYINETLIPAVLAEDATEESRKQAEAARVAAEQVRQSNEAARQNAEAQRVSAENARNVWEDYSSSKAYAVGNKVASAGSSYLCIKPCTGIAPPNAEYWRLIAAKGAKGDTGAQGAQGPQGAIGPEGPVGGSSNFVRYDAAQTLTDAQKQQARANIAAAPSGGGVMETTLEVDASSASESYDTFCAKLDEVLATMPSRSVKFLRVYPPQYYGFGSDMCALFKNTNDYASVYTIGSYNEERQGFRMIKHKRYTSDPAGHWDPLEYINPEMKLGVEYRTTERFLGKPVYVKVVDCGNLPNADIKSVSIGTSGLEKVIDISGCIVNDSNGDFYSIPATNFNVALHNVGLYATGAQSIAISTQSDRSSYSAYVKVKYTKTTD